MLKIKLYVLSISIYLYNLHIYMLCVCFLQLIPGAGLHQKHLGFEWGPGDLLVYETNYRLQGIHIHTGKTLHSVNV